MLLKLMLFLVVAAIGWRLLTRKLRRNSVPTLSSSTSLLESHATSFGFKKVREDQKNQMITDIFENIVLKYDLLNDIKTAGFHRVWKNRLVSKLNPFPGIKHIDMAGGTGDISFRILDAMNRNKSQSTYQPQDDLQDEAQIYVCDISPSMLNCGKKKAVKKGYGEEKSLIWLEENAETLRFKDNSMDSYTISFGIRNVTHMDKVLAEAYRVLKPGGRFLCLEFFRVDTPIIKQLYDLYSFNVIPFLGEVIVGDRASYQYFVESIRRFPPQQTLATIMEEAGFKKVEYENLLGGVVAIHSGLKL